VAVGRTCRELSPGSAHLFGKPALPLSGSIASPIKNSRNMGDVFH
jgi:hypothetical protein